MAVTILTTRRDYATTRVLDWLTYHGEEFCCIPEFEFEKEKLSIIVSSDNIVSVNYEGINIGQYSNWVRRYVRSKLGFGEIENYFADYIGFEAKTLQIGLISALNEGNRIGRNSQYLDPLNVNKIHVLIKASEAGLSVPDTLISNDRNKIIIFLSKHQKVILKPSSQPLIFRSQNKIYKTLTKVVCKEDIESGDIVLPLCFQECIDKEFEVRVFFLNDEFYASAIFSQESEKTRIDYRNYDDDCPNRVVPYELSEAVRDKLKVLMRQLGLNSGSIDLMKAINGSLYFLEVNPVGQFSGNAEMCNFGVHNTIAKNLMQI